VKTLIRGGDVVAYDGHGHNVNRGGEVVFENDRILFAGQSYPGEANEVIEAQGKLVCPGFINILGWAALDVPLRMDAYHSARLFSEEFIVRGIGTEQLKPALGDDYRTLCLSGLASLLEGGSTTTITVTAMDPMPFESPMEQTEILAKTAGEIGARAYVAHNYRSAIKYSPEPGLSRYHWNDEAGHAGLKRALQFAEKYHGSYGGRVQTMLHPYTFDCSTPQLMQATKQAGRENSLLIHMFAAHTHIEFNESKRRFGKTPVRYLYDIGFLDPMVILVHVHYTSLSDVSGHIKATPVTWTYW
jgi:cytosine/adenosine deaminase-related metal-dependent hydrolase